MSQCNFLSDVTCPIFNFTEVSTSKVREIIVNLRNSDAKDVYDLSVPMIKYVKDVIISPLTKLINMCIRSSTFPDCLKLAKVIPLFKKGNSNDANNYRPISLLPIFAKILEKILHEQLEFHLESNNLISSRQSGFR